jgi:hypothetical protein
MPAISGSLQTITDEGRTLNGGRRVPFSAPGAVSYARAAVATSLPQIAASDGPDIKEYFRLAASTNQNRATEKMRVSLDPLV